MISHFTRACLLSLFTAAGFLLPACTPVSQHPAWDMPPFGADDVALYRAFEQSCKVFARRPASREVSSDPRFGTYGQWQAICAEAMRARPDQLPSILARTTYEVEMDGPGKFTGYYKPVLEGSLTRHGPYQTPLVARPLDLVTCPDGKTGQRHPDGTCTSPYPSRGYIETNIERYEPIAWLKDPVDAFFLHVQGSGTLELDNGQTLHVGFAGKNGHKYVSIGRILREKGELNPPITADSIKRWLAANPHRRDEILHGNPSYIFFTVTEEESPGAFGVPLTPGRSLAVDRAHVPLGLPVRVKTILTGDGNTAINRLMLAQDVGSAIKGASRGDIYFGHGPMAGKIAGSQNASGKLYTLAPRP